MKKIMRVILSITILMAFIGTSLGLTSIAVKSIKLNTASVKLSVGKTYRLKVTFTPVNATKKGVMFSSGNKSIATVSSTGYIKGIKAGKTVITVTSTSNKKAIAKCNVTIVLQAYKPVTLNYYRVQWGDRPLEDPNEYAIKAKIKEKLNIDLKIVGPKNPSSQLEKFWIMIAAGEQIDFASGGVSGNDYDRLIKDKVIVPIQGLLKSNGLDILNNVNMDVMRYAYGDKEGNIWAVPYESNTLNDGNILHINKEVLKKHNLKIPKTIEEFENFLQFAKEENLEGLIGASGAGLDCLNSIFSGCFIPAPSGSNYKTQDGKIAPWFTHEKMKDYLTAMNKWYKNGWLHKEFAVLSSDQFISTFFTGKASAAIQWWTGVMDKRNMDLPSEIPEVLAPLKFKIYEPIITPKGPAGVHMFKGNGWAGDGVVITVMCKYPERAMDYLNYAIGTVEGFNLTRAGVEGINYTLDDVNGKKVFKAIEGKASGWHFYVLPLKKINMDPNNLYNRVYMIEMTNFMDSLPAEYSIDSKVRYDRRIMKSNEKFNEMETLINEAMTKIIMGAATVSSWDDTIKKWRSIGGDLYIDELTQQFNEWNSK